MTTINSPIPRFAGEPAVALDGSTKQTISFAKIYAITMIVLTAVFTFGIWIPTWLLLDESATGLGVGLMSALWGAPGFGIMIAGAIWTEQQA